MTARDDAAFARIMSACTAYAAAEQALATNYGVLRPYERAQLATERDNAKSRLLATIREAIELAKADKT